MVDLKRRSFVRASLAAAGSVGIAGCLGGIGFGDRAGFPSHDVPEYSDWIPAERARGDGGVVFTHIDFSVLNELEDGDADDGAVIDEIPIVALPIYGSVLTVFTTFGLIRYPFTAVILPERGQSTDGIDTSSMTWTDDIVVFHGNYDRSTFERDYANGFEAIEERNGFTVYEGSDDAAGLSFAVNEGTVIVVMDSIDGKSVPGDVLSEALERRLDEIDRIVDEEDGRWLFETTGSAPMVFGVWDTPDIAEEFETDEDDDVEGPDPEVDDNPAIGDVNSLVNVLDFTLSDSGRIDSMEARLAALFPSDDVPSVEEIREHVVGSDDVPHEIIVEGRRVHVTATVDIGDND